MGNPEDNPFRPPTATEIAAAEATVPPDKQEPFQPGEE